MDRYKLKQLLGREEGPKLDFKACLSLTTESEKKELTKDVIAIANSRGGRGYIIFGVEDKTKKLLGIDPGDFKEEQIQQIIYNRSDPPVPVSVEFIKMDEKLIAVLTIFRSSHCPHQMLQNGAFYVRRGSTTDVARRSEIANMFQEYGLMTYETVVIKNAQPDAIDFELIKQYFASMNAISEKPDYVLLEALGIVGELDDGVYCPTIGGLLLFGKNPSVYIPQAYVKVIYGEKTVCFFGNILKLLDDSLGYIKETVTDEGYPFDAVEEALANALVHRDYLDNSRGINVVVTEKNIEISNPGAFTAGDRIYRYMKENNPSRRNAWLYQRLLTLDPKKRFLKSGIGMNRIKKAFRDIGEVKFLNIGRQNLFKVIMPRRKVV